MSPTSSRGFSSTPWRVLRTSRKSVSRYRSPARRGESRHGRLLHSSRSHGSGTWGCTATCLRGLLAEVDLGNLLGFGRHLEEWIFLEAEHLRRQIGGELATRRVVLLHLFVIAHAFDRETVLGTGELVHQAIELLVRLQHRIVLDHGEQ